MKIQSLLIATVLAIGASQAARAQAALEASSQTVTIAFTGKTQIPGYAEKVDGETSLTTDYSSEKLDKDDNVVQTVEGYKMGSASYKYGNKEILQETLGQEESISGYSLVYQDGALLAVNAKTGDEQSVDVDISQLAEMEAFTASTVTTTNNTYKSGELTSTTQTYSDSGTIEGPISVTYGGSEMVGYAAGSYKTATWYEASEDPETGKTTLDKSVANSVTIPGAVKITGLSGSTDSDYGTDIFTGSVNLAAAKAVKSE